MRSKCYTFSKESNQEKSPKMHDFTITTVGRKEVSFTFEDAMYVAAAVYKHDYSQNASTIRGDLWAALKFYFGWYYSDKLMKERGIDSKMFLSDQYYISDKELDAIVHYIFEVAFTRLLCK